ncbi:hypothetical protein [Streptomyces chryseus]|uniref:Integral membrane protein n=1 Tax=Streptomyces chryseus TaxID=68186 RepID=A0ABQ3DN05_9ACTN|nr:hypothetical protein [Streptomyces chryseus]GGX07639.1 hypothetical protein GCM10010353_23790 [Streptomyces chryseus]GHB00386.1 hypothetical protein GCM10010346_24090 [Streptomyces chryseus]
MALEEKRAWSMLLVAIVSYAVFLALVLGRAGDEPLARTPYVAALLWTVGGAIVANIVLHIALAALSPEDADTKDQRDREIHRFGEHVGQSFVVLGGVAGLVLAMAGSDQFWIANAIYLAFVLSSLLGSVTKIVSYRLGFHPW